MNRKEEFELKTSSNTERSINVKLHYYLFPTKASMFQLTQNLHNFLPFSGKGAKCCKPLATL